MGRFRGWRGDKVGLRVRESWGGGEGRFGAVRVGLRWGREIGSTVLEV